MNQLKKFTSLLIIIFFSQLTYGQVNPDRIVLKNSFWTGTAYFKNSEKIKTDEVRSLMSSNQEALEVFNSGVKQQSSANIFAILGGGLIGWPIGGAIGGADDPKWFLAGIGAGFVIIGSTIYSSGGKKIKRGLDFYNSQFSSIEGLDKSSFVVSFTQTSSGLGIKLNF